MSMDPATVRHVAKLARIKIKESDLPRLQNELNGILSQAEQLREVDVDGVTPLAGGLNQALALRDDVVTDGGKAEQIMANAPARTYDFFTVPKVVE